ncbi:hypothetical protein AJ79_04030 [Helicocarpus griseus UAMH5409]|uniref:Succinate dehydrogenase assembly factor 4, mitochondrial n=1 Tax=Helicocarpus griseus UAMH5409 TaxID=1447875 RepID=A0A2B7XUC0_9EURO|nr:hypothetical protein AJ79_04030 [Helicocarpus griseus UAMH5409]
MAAPFTLRHLRPNTSLSTISRAFSTTPITRSQFKSSPSPPRLPREEQEIFENLQKQSTGAFSTPRSPPTINQSPQSQSEESTTPQFEASGSGEELHPDLRGGAKPEFKGEKNPKTGEVGGPKNEPLRWGAEGDWSFNGRVTDF